MSFQPQTPYEELGGDTTVRALVDAFYDIMDADPQAAEIRAMHPQDLAESREKLYMFLSGWLGGPALYIEKYGHPRLRARHLPFPIGNREAAQWLYCMATALKQLEVPERLGEPLMQSFAMTASHMQNT